jgi:hypothetical protein
MPSPQRASKVLRTPGLETPADLAARISLMRDVAAEHGRRDPLDVVFMPAGLDMFSKARPDHPRVVDELHALAQLGVTWATVTLPGDTRAELLEAIDAFGAGVIRPLGRP